VLLALVAEASFAQQAAPNREGSVPIGPSSVARFAGAAEASGVLTKKDAFLSAMTPIDRSARLQVARSVSEQEYLRFVSNQTLDWTPAEHERLRGYLAEFRARTAPWNLALPPEVTFVKTTGREEGGAAYCREAAVVLPESYLARGPVPLRDVVFHELFHVFSSHHPEKRAALYAVVSFELCPEIWLPPSLAKRKLTNPDAPRLDSVIRLPRGDKRVPATPILLLRGDAYDERRGGPFFTQLDATLLGLEDLGTMFRPIGVTAGRPSPLLIPETDEQYLALVGRNTKYTIHPEEILADNFVLLVDRAKVPSPEILDKLDAVLKR
jgi:hypothetical protein